ncbi:MAG: hypothetical protein D6695_05820 [Planctomycetota bacterium]|nr:MAG: hypothetical protein D6695_05820 [Planctomycetota bacterium]
MALSAACGILPCLFLSGCGQESEASKAIDEASRSIDAIAAGGGAAMEPEITASYFKDAGTALERTSLDGTKVEKAGVMVLKARAETGLAAAESLEIGRLERELAAKYAVMRAEIRAWEQANATAEAAESYDPSGELAELAKALDQINESMDAATKTKAQVDARISELESQIEGLKQQARAEREKAATLELRASKLSAIDAAKLAPQIQVHAQAAEHKLFEVSRLEARMDHLRTEATEAALTLAKLEQQRVLNDQARAEIERVRDEFAAEARAARAEADQAALNLRRLTDEVLAFRAGTDEQGLNALLEAHTSRLRSAVSSARQATSDLRVGANLALASANVALADALSLQARSHEDLARVLERAATASPALDDASWYAERAAEARAQAESAMNEARQAYDAAARGFESAGGSTETRALLSELSGRLKESAGGGPASEDEPVEQNEPAGDDEGATGEVEG